MSQVIYELKPGGVDERRLVGAKLEKLAEGESGEKGPFLECFIFVRNSGLESCACNNGRHE